MDCEDAPCLKREAQQGSRLIATDQFKSIVPVEHASFALHIVLLAFGATTLERHYKNDSLMSLLNKYSSQNSNSSPGHATSKTTAGAFSDVGLGGDAVTCWEVVAELLWRHLGFKIPENTT